MLAGITETRRGRGRTRLADDRTLNIRTWMKLIFRGIATHDTARSTAGSRFKVPERVSIVYCQYFFLISLELEKS